MKKGMKKIKKIVKIMAIITLLGFLISFLCLIIASNSGDDNHWGYVVFGFMITGIGWMWIGKAIHDEDKKKK